MKHSKSLLPFLLILAILAATLPVAANAPLPSPLAIPTFPQAAGSWQRVWKGEGAVYALAGVDAQTVLGAGSDGMIIASTDGGASWRYQSPTPSQDLYDLSLAGSRAWAVGQGGVVLGSGDSGATWRQLATGLAPNLNGVHFLNAANGWTVGAGGAILYSSDGGISWTPQASGVSTALNAVRMFADGQHGLAVGDAGVVLITANGGATWTPRAGVGNPAAPLRDIHIEGNQAWIVGDAGVLRYSNDMGATWNPKNIPYFHIHEIEFAPGQDRIGWVAGVRVNSGITEERVMKTTDGGATWALIGAVADSDFALQRTNKVQTGTSVTALGVSDATHAWVGGGAEFKNLGNYYDTPDDLIPRTSWYIWRTSNGAQWSHMIGGFYPWFYNITAPTESVAYITGHDMTVLKSTDGGTTWRELAYELRATPELADAVYNHRGDPLHGVSCAPGDPNDCHMSGREGIIAHTIDGGETWTREFPPSYGNSVYDLNMTTKTRGVALGRGAHFYTLNGRLWQQGTGGATGLDIDMVSETQGGRASKRTDFFAYTLNGGLNWRSYIMPTKYFPWQTDGFDAYDANGDGELDHGWLAGCVKAAGNIDTQPCQAPAILHNANLLDPAGWQDTVLVDEPIQLERIEMFDTTTGWATGEKGRIYFSEDSGATWVRQLVSADGWLNALDVYSRNLVFVAGEDGVVFRYAQPDRRLTAAAQGVVNIDGDLSDWNAVFQRTISSAEVDTITGAEPTPTDLSADVRVRWDDRYFYIGVHVSDDAVMTDPANLDRFAIAFDGAQDGQKGPDDHTLRFGADGSFSVDGAAPPAAWMHAVRVVPGGYDIEARIPAAAFGGDFVHLRKMGVNIALYDADATSGAAAQADPQSVLVWVGDSLDGDPAHFGELTLFQFDRQQPQLTALPAGNLTFDGNLSDWSADATYLLTAGSADSVQGTPPTDAADLSAQLRLRWWGDYLFFGLHVSDATLTFDDAIAIAFDPSGDGKPGAGDHEFMIWPTGRVLQDGGPAQGVLAVGQPGNAGYDIEIAIPASLLGGSFEPHQTLHFNYGLIDADASPTTVATHLNWQGASVAGIQADFGSLAFQPLEIDIKAAPGGGPVRDTVLDQWNPDKNNGTYGYLLMRPTGAQQSLIRFDLASLPANAQVKKANLYLYVIEREIAPLETSLYRLLRPWDEFQATWNRASTGNPWQTPGASGPTDRAAQPSAQATLGRAGAYTGWDVTHDLQAFMGGAPNYGWLLNGAAATTALYKLASSNWSDAATLPVMNIEYILPGGTLPTPTPVASATPTSTSTATITPTSTATPTFTPSPTATPSPTDTATPTASPTPSATLRPSPTTTATPTATLTPTFTPTATPTSTPTDTPTPTATTRPLIPLWLPLIQQ